MSDSGGSASGETESGSGDIAHSGPPILPLRTATPAADESGHSSDDEPDGE